MQQVEIRWVPTTRNNTVTIKDNSKTFDSVDHGVLTKHHGMESWTSVGSPAI